MPDIILVYITNPSRKIARTMANMLLAKKLIACANIFSINSMYWWNGRIAEEKEWVLIAKTRAAHYARVQKEVRAVHPYKVPCIIKIQAEANAAYGKWLMKETVAKKV